MAVTIRMTRTGGKNDACYRVVAADTHSPRDGRNVEILGWYDPCREGVNFSLKMDRVAYWQSQGAQVSDTVSSLLKQARKLPAGAMDTAAADAPTAAEPAAAAEA